MLRIEHTICILAPQLGLPGLLQTAVAARQLGNESWLQHHNATKHLLVSLQDHEGNYSQPPGIEPDPLEFEAAVAGPAWDTAHAAMYCIRCNRRVWDACLAIEQPANLLARDSSGKANQSGGSWQHEWAGRIEAGSG